MKNDNKLNNDKEIIYNFHINTEIFNPLSSDIQYTKILNKKKIRKIALGSSHSIILTESGVLYSFGKNDYLQLGINNVNKTNSYLDEPVIITDLLNYRVTDISAGDNHNIAFAFNRNNSYSNEVDNNSYENSFDKQVIFVWGNNSHQQCGLNKVEQCTTPVILSLANIAVLNIAENFLPFKISSFSVIKSVNCYGNLTTINFGSLIYLIGELPSYLKSSSHQSILTINEFSFDEYIFTKDCFITTCLNKKMLFFLNNEDYKFYNKKEVPFVKNISKDKSIVKLIEPLKLSKKIKLSSAYLDEISTNNEKFINKIILDLDSKVISIDNRISIEETEKKEFMLLSILKISSHETKYEVILNLAHFNDFIIKESKSNDNDTSTVSTKDSHISLNTEPLEELKNYISMIGLSIPDNDNLENNFFSSSGFRPSNLPKKSKDEEEYHKKLVEENRRLYLSYLKEKQENIKKEETNYKETKKKDFDQAKIWETEIIPLWFKKKRDNEIKKYFYDGIPPFLRSRIWLMCIGNNFSITKDYYDIEVVNSM